MDNLKTILSEIGKSSLEDVGDVYSIVGDLTGMVGLDIADNDIFSFIGNSGETTGTVDLVDGDERNISFRGDSSETDGGIG